jgi:hypothetical protein
MFFFFSSPAERAAAKLRQEREASRRLPLAVPWTEKISFQKELNIQAESYSALQLFQVEPTDSADPAGVEEHQRIVSPCGSWMYCVKRLPRGRKLDIFSGNKQGTVMFDGPVLIPCLHQASQDGWRKNPWMSLTPMEMLTLRGGTRLAKGTVAVAGLGLGHQLIEVSRRKQVKKLILIEKNQELIDWLLPQIRPHLARPLDEVMVEDVYSALPKLQADVALVDIFPGFGDIRWEEDRLSKLCAGKVGRIWCWGKKDR